MTIPRASLSRFWPLGICLIVSLIIIRAYFHPGVPITHDGENHLARFANYKIALKEGQWPPRFAPNLFHHYGYPVFNYNYPLPNILSAPFSVVKTSYLLTFKFLMSAGLVLILLGIWTWLGQLGLKFKAKLLAITSTAVSPYLLQTVIYRGSIGEVLALACISWWLVWVESLRSQSGQNSKVSWRKLIFSPQTLFGAIILGAFFLSHNVTVLFGTPALLAVAIWRLWADRAKLLHVLGAFLAGLGLSLWFWLPALMEQSAIIVGGSSLAQQYLQHFPTFSELISSPLQFGFSYVGPVDSLSFGLGWVQWAALLCGLGWLGAMYIGRQKVSSKSLNQVLLVSLLVTTLLVVFQLALTASVWQLVSLARFIQFPWRLGLFTTLSSAVVIGWVAHQQVRWQITLLTFLVIAQVIVALRLAPVGYLNKSNLEYELFEQSTTTSNENLPKDFTHQDYADWRPTPIALEGEADFVINQWTGSKRSYTVNAVTPVVIIEPTMYFPGWVTQGEQNGVAQNIPYSDSKVIGGRIGYQLEPGSYQITTQFTQWTTPRIIGNAVSIFTALLIGGAIIWWKKENKQKKLV